MDEVKDDTSIISMEHEEMDKRKACPNALEEEDTPHPKRIQHEFESLDCIDIHGFDTGRHFLDRKTIFQYFFHYGKPMEDLALKIENDDQNKELIGKCMDSLRKVFVEGVDSSSLRSFVKSAIQLFHTSALIQAEDLDKSLLLPFTMDTYKSKKQAKERMQILIQDSYLKHVLQDEMGCFPITRFVLSVLFGYWGDYAVYTNLCSAIEMDKEKASPIAFDEEDTPHPERIQQESDSQDCFDIDFEDGVSHYTKPHILYHKTILKYFFEDEKPMELLADIVERNDQLQKLIAKCMDSLRKVYVNGVDSAWVLSFDESAKDLFNCPAFIQICVDAYFEELDDCYQLPLTIELYKDEKQPSERMESLMGDDYMKDVLKDERGSVPITRVVLSVLFGYWSDDAFYRKVTSEIDYVGSHIDKQRRANPKICRVEKVDGVCCPASVEGLKDLLCSKYPEDEANFMCKQIDYKRKQYDWILPAKGMVITSYNFVMRDNKFYMPLIVLSVEDN